MEAVTTKDTAKRNNLFKLIHLSEEQETIIELYYRDVRDGLKHWQQDPEDPNVYIEYLNGIAKLKKKIEIAEQGLRNITNNKEAMAKEAENAAISAKKKARIGEITPEEVLSKPKISRDAKGNYNRSR